MLVGCRIFVHACTMQPYTGLIFGQFILMPTIHHIPRLFIKQKQMNSTPLRKRTELLIPCIKRSSFLKSTLKLVIKSIPNQNVIILLHSINLLLIIPSCTRVLIKFVGLRVLIKFKSEGILIFIIFMSSACFRTSKYIVRFFWHNSAIAIPLRFKLLVYKVDAGLQRMIPTMPVSLYTFFLKTKTLIRTGIDFYDGTILRVWLRCSSIFSVIL